MRDRPQHRARRDRARLLFALILAPPLVAGSGIVPAEAQAPLVGRWDAEARTRGGLGEWLEFRADGSVLSSFGAMVDVCCYRWEAGRLVVTAAEAAAAGKGSEQGRPIRFEGATVHGVRDVPMRRVGAAATDAPPIVGVWAFPHYVGLTAYEEFTRDGRMLFRLPMQSREGRYRLAGDTLTVVWKDGPPETINVRMIGETLVMTRQGQPERRYRREQGSIPAVDQAEVEAFRKKSGGP